MVVFAAAISFGFTIAVQNSYSLIYNNLVHEYKHVPNNVVYAGMLMLSMLVFATFFLKHLFDFQYIETQSLDWQLVDRISIFYKHSGNDAGRFD